MLKLRLNSDIFKEKIKLSNINHNLETDKNNIKIQLIRNNFIIQKMKSPYDTISMLNFAQDANLILSEKECEK